MLCTNNFRNDKRWQSRRRHRRRDQQHTAGVFARPHQRHALSVHAKKVRITEKSRTQHTIKLHNINSTLQVYSPAHYALPTICANAHSLKLSNFYRYSRYRSIAQVDLAPTVALLLGTPIPFGSLGALIPELFLNSDLDGDWEPQLQPAAGSGVRAESLLPSLARTTQLMHLNLRQTYEYVLTYARTRSLFSEQQMTHLREMYHRAMAAHAELLRRAHTFNDAEESVREYAAVLGGYRAVQQHISLLCRQLWTSFDEPRMVRCTRAHNSLLCAIFSCALTELSAYFASLVTLSTDRRNRAVAMQRSHERVGVRIGRTFATRELRCYWSCGGCECVFIIAKARHRVAAVASCS